MTCQSTRRTVVAILTITDAAGFGFATDYRCGDLPKASSVNFGPGQTRPNELISKLSSDGTICVFTRAGTHVILDVVGYS